CTILPKLLRISFSGHADHESEVPVAASLYPGDGIFNNNRTARRDLQKSCRHQKSIWRRFSGQSLRVNRVAVDTHRENSIQLGSLQYRIAVVARRDDRNSKPLSVKQSDEVDTALIRLHPRLLDNLVDQIVLAVTEPAHRVSLGRVVGTPFLKQYATRPKE